MPSINIKLDDRLFNALKKRAEKNFLSIREMVEDIVSSSLAKVLLGAATLKVYPRRARAGRITLPLVSVLESIRTEWCGIFPFCR